MSGAPACEEGCASNARLFVHCMRVGQGPPRAPRVGAVVSRGTTALIDLPPPARLAVRSSPSAPRGSPFLAAKAVKTPLACAPRAAENAPLGKNSEMTEAYLRFTIATAGTVSEKPSHLRQDGVGASGVQLLQGLQPGHRQVCGGRSNGTIVLSQFVSIRTC